MSLIDFGKFLNALSGIKNYSFSFVNLFLCERLSLDIIEPKK